MLNFGYSLDRPCIIPPKNFIKIHFPPLCLPNASPRSPAFRNRNLKPHNLIPTFIEQTNRLPGARFHGKTLPLDQVVQHTVVSHALEDLLYFPLNLVLHFFIMIESWVGLVYWGIEIDWFIKLFDWKGIEISLEMVFEAHPAVISVLWLRPTKKVWLMLNKLH